MFQDAFWLHAYEHQITELSGSFHPMTITCQLASPTPKQTTMLCLFMFFLSLTQTTIIRWAAGNSSAVLQRLFKD